MLGLFGSLALTFATSVAATENRLVFSALSHEWLRAVGKLQVPGQRPLNGRTAHYIEDCSATLVAQPGSSSANTLVTAWHCLEWHGDLSRPILFLVTSASGETMQREAYRLQDGGGMHADWAILRLQESIPATAVASLTIHPQAADPEQPVLMAGFSKDPGIGNGGRTLTFDPHCAITNHGGDVTDTNCTAFKGASGGAVVQLSGSGKPQVCGVISQGNGEGRSTYIPVDGFRNALNSYLR
jgi:hypothetical protein